MQQRNISTAIRTAIAIVAVSPALALAAPALPQCPAPATEFAPGQVSSAELFDSRLAFTPSRNSVYWSVTAEPSPPGSSVVSTILSAQRVAGGWSAPAIAGFSGVYSDGDPFVSPYGERMYFSSSRPGTARPSSRLQHHDAVTVRAVMRAGVWHLACAFHDVQRRLASCIDCNVPRAARDLR